MAWLAYVWKRIRDSLWFLPGLMTLAGAVLAAAFANLDRVVGRAEFGHPLLYNGSADGARALLATVAGSMITVAGVVFGVTMVVLSLASSQFGPRLLSNFMRDRGNQLVLGAFFGTFIFCLLALGSTPEQPGAIVSASASAGLMLAVISLLLLIYFIHHIASAMQADNVIDEVARQVDSALSRIFPDEAPAEPAPGTPLPVDDAAQAHLVVPSPATGYLQAIDESSLLTLACQRGLRLRILRRPGHFIIAGAPLVAVTGPVDDVADTVEGIGACFFLGGRRTAEQDPEYGVHQLVEIAVRALSPGINDPFTAIACIDRLSGALGRIAAVPVRPPVRYDPEGDPRLLLDPIDFAGVLDAAFNQIRQCAASSPSVSIRLLEALAGVAGAAVDAARHREIARHGRMVYEGCAGSMNPGDRQVFEQRYQLLCRALLPEARPGDDA